MGRRGGHRSIRLQPDASILGEQDVLIVPTHRKSEILDRRRSVLALLNGVSRTRLAHMHDAREAIVVDGRLAKRLIEVAERSDGSWIRHHGKDRWGEDRATFA